MFQAAILYNLKLRHVHGKPYTRTGDIIIACNPYQWFHHLYSEDVRCRYAETLVWNTTNTDDAFSKKLLEPHVYETSSMAYRGLCMEGEDQSILVSGESGAGKTETVKILLTDIASVQRRAMTSTEYAHDTTTSSPIVQRVLDSNPLLEAFGNAKTVRNDNSSRFGKYIQLQFDCEDPVQAAYSGKSIPACVLAGSKCEVYLLEKSRVVHHEDAERTYHIFYQLLAAPEETKVAIWQGLAGTDNESFRYVGYTDTDTIEGQSDAERFSHTVASLALVGVTDDKLQTLFRAICIVLQLGNLVFVSVDDDESNKNKNETRTIIDCEDDKDKNTFQALSELMGVSTELLSAALTVRTVKARNEIFKVPLSAVAAKDSCDAFAKEIYAKAFLWLVRSINDATCAENNYDYSSNIRSYGVIGLLDIFGFESFETNRFEQLCINYANEKLQQKFTQDVFRSVQAEYEYEGIELGEITYDDNTDVLDLVEGRMGLIAFLNEECLRPGGSDKGFVSKAAAMNKENACFIRENGFDEFQFGVQHYAGRVIYDASCFVTKNMDTLPTDLQECATKSSNLILANELTNEAVMNAVVVVTSAKMRRKVPPPLTTTPVSAPGKRKSSNLVGETVWTKFRNQLTSLMANLKQTRTRYIRCIKPNTTKQPLIMQHVSTVEQLRCAGVVAAVTISRSAFPNRLEHVIVLDRFKALWGKGEHLHAEEIAATLTDDEDRFSRLVECMLTAALKSLETVKDGNVVKAFVMGKTRTYFRAGALEYLENERVKCLSRWAVEIQRIGRKFIARSRYIRIRKVAICLESLVRMLLVRRSYLWKRSAAIKVECWHRCIYAVRTLVRLRRNYKATLLQTHWRVAMAVTRLKANRRAAVVVQKIVRGALQRPKYRVALVEKREEAKLENQVLALQRKLEEAERRRVEAEKKAEEKAHKTIEEYKATGRKPAEEKKEDEKSAADQSETSSLTNVDEPVPPSPGQISAQQQTLMDESGKMLEYLRKEVFKLRSHNAQMRSDFDLLKDNNQRLMDANASAGASFAALNQHAKQLSRANDKLTSDLLSYKQQVQKLSVTQVELKEELKMKQATYVAEVHSRLQYQKALSKIIDVAQERCRDDRLVEEFLRIADTCEAEYMSGPTGMNLGTGLFTPKRAGSSSKGSGNDSGIISSFRNLWS
jgi:myosin V